MRRAALALFATVAGLVGLLSFKSNTSDAGRAHAAISTVGPGTTSGSTTAAPSATAAPSGTSTPSATGSASSSSAATTRTVTGNSVDTRWGPVQVRITVRAGKLTATDAIVYPQNNGRDQQINSYAIPELQKEALAAGNAKIDMITGATYTSQGYIGSLQSALDKAGI